MGSTGLVAQKNRQEPKPVIYHGDKRTSHRLKTIQWPSFLVCDFTNPIVPELDHHFLVGRSPKRRGLSHDMPLSPTISTCTFKNNVRNISWRYDNIFEYICYVLYTVYIIIYIYIIIIYIYIHIIIYTHNNIYIYISAWYTMVAIWPSGSLRFFQTSSPLAMENPPFWISQQATGLTFHTEDATRPTTKAKLEPITLKWEHHGDIHCGYIYIWYTEFYYIWIYIIFNMIYIYIFIYIYIYMYTHLNGEMTKIFLRFCADMEEGYTQLMVISHWRHMMIHRWRRKVCPLQAANN